jgi:hypothetical protein
MKYAITGHTEGLGAGLFERLSPDIIGFSRSNGYDVNNIDSRFQILKECKKQNIKVFINNANDGFSQTLMLIDLMKSWGRNPIKTIVNIGSRIADPNIPVGFDMDKLSYQAEKLSLKTLHEGLKKTVSCRLIYWSSGYIWTKKIQERYPDLKDYITVDEACCDIIKKINS